MRSCSTLIAPYLMHSCRPQQGHFRRGSNHYSSPESFDDDPPAISFTERRHRNSTLGNGEQKCRNKNQSRPAILFSSMTSKPALRKAWFEAKFCVGEMASTVRTPSSRPARSADKRNS